MDYSLRDAVAAMTAAQQEQQKDHQNKQDSLENTQAIVDALKLSIVALVHYFDTTDFAVDVKNFPDSISTPDVQAVVSEIRDLKKQIASSKDTATHSLLENLLQAIQKLPTAFPEYPETPEPVEEVTVKNMPDYSVALKDVLAAIKAIEMHVEPQVTVKPADVTVNTDLTALEEQITTLIAAVNAIKLVVPATDNSEVIAAVESVTNAISNLRFPVPNFTSAFKDVGGAAVSAIVDELGGAVTTSAPIAQRIDDQGTILYIGESTVGAATAEAVWRIRMLDTTGGLTALWADGDANFDNVWDDRATLTYS